MKSYSVTQLLKEADFNKALKSAERSRSMVKLLFHSLWDENSQRLVAKVLEKNCDNSPRQVFLVNSLDTPLAFKLFKPDLGYVVPYLAVVDYRKYERKHFILDWTPHIYKELGIS